MKNLMCKLLGIVLIFSIYANNSFSTAQKSFLEAPELIKNPSSNKKYQPETREFTGISSMAVSPKGRLWVVWYAGITPGEDLNNYVVVSTSGDDGKTWEEVLVIDPDGPGPVRAFDPEVWIDPDGKLWIFWAQAAALSGGTWALVTEGTLAGVWALKIDDPETNEPELNSPFRITDGVMMCKPIVLSTGEWVLPVSMWKMEKECARMVVSTDGGKSWNVRGGASVFENVRSYDEHMIVERKNGSLWMLFAHVMELVKVFPMTGVIPGVRSFHQKFNIPLHGFLFTDLIPVTSCL
jgi:hypothetical protein